jgi:sulfatase maturation enzyme AslB (radical SAM superfamily)
MGKKKNTAGIRRSRHTAIAESTTKQQQQQHATQQQQQQQKRRCTWTKWCKKGEIHSKREREKEKVHKSNGDLKPQKNSTESREKNTG